MFLIFNYLFQTWADLFLIKLLRLSNEEFILNGKSLWLLLIKNLVTFLIFVKYRYPYKINRFIIMSGWIPLLFLSILGFIVFDSVVDSFIDNFTQLNGSNSTDMLEPPSNHKSISNETTCFNIESDLPHRKEPSNIYPLSCALFVALFLFISFHSHN